MRNNTPEQNRSQKDDRVEQHTESDAVETAAGAAAGGVAGAAIGSGGGPAGAVAGAAIGAVAGGLVGKGVGQAVDATVEDNYWRENYRTRPYVPEDSHYEQFAPAYRFGWEGRAKHGGRKFEDVERTLERDWERFKGRCRLSWADARHAVRDAWDRVSQKYSQPPNG